MSPFAPASGSSPRVRGTRRGHEPVRSGVRFIPARAGNSPNSASVSLEVAVHPRACGELAVELDISIKDYGSSPRVRGTLDCSHCRLIRKRFIPARAGNSMAGSRKWLSNSVHPRACGELSYRSGLSSSLSGSSPRVRGTLRFTPGDQPRCRFIPARAGNSSRLTLTECPSSVHPRACGELFNAADAVALCGGSSPRVRGTPGWRGKFRWRRRFIPARAGNSQQQWQLCAVRTVHPRACGELLGSITSSPPRTGSSPRVRGTHARSLGRRRW